MWQRFNTCYFLEGWKFKSALQVSAFTGKDMGFCEKKNKSEKKKEFNTSSLLLIVTNFFLVFLDIYFAEGHINLPGS